MNSNESRLPRYPTLWRLIENQAGQMSSSIAIAAPGRAPLTYTGLYDQVAAAAAQLGAMGIGPGDRVAISLPNGPEMAVAFLAIAAVATSSPLNPDYTAHEFEFYLSDLNPVALVVQSAGDLPAVVAQSLGIRIVELSPRLDAEAGVFSLSGGGSNQRSGALTAGEGDLALILHTSGTTSRPKRVGLTQANILASAYNIRDTLSLTEADRCLNIMPLFHIHGLVGALLSSLAGGSSVVCCPGFHAPRFLDWVNESQPTWYTAVPTMHQAILARAAEDEAKVRTARFRFIRSASSPLPARVMADLERVFKAPVVEAYGMTEASHQITSNPLPPAERRPGTVGVVGATEVAIMDEDGRLLPCNQMGEIVLSGANVINGYLNDLEANCSSFLNGWFKTGDRGYLDTGGYLTITGRTKEIINRGGEKISPREIDEILLEHPSIAQAVCFAFPDPVLGEDVAAALVLRDGAAATDFEIRDFVAGKLASFKVPGRLIFVSEIPKGPTGKVQRIGLAARLGIAGDSEGKALATKVDYIAPRTPIESKLVAIWEDVLSRKRIGVQDTFSSIGGDSILAAMVISRVRESLQISMSPASLFGSPTVESMALAVTHHMGKVAGQQDMKGLLHRLETLSDEEAATLLDENPDLFQSVLN